ncbi:MAG: hypothetical protein IJM92_09255 [Fibrobacter sp.]|uniref:hypothetical protein n=1 Tax=Fibrobacter sp. TaxID=35828 RepID=UPI0025C6214F|nr:hypothetical protein [Fibrobacter sp.]MBQ7079830.1 hypothetical protein [Fibrobacter sp.]
MNEPLCREEKKLMQVPELFEKHHSTLKKTSLDDSTSPVIYMSESEQEVVDFDAVKEEYKKKFCCNTGDARSCDALLIDNENIALIEFKNGKITDSKEKEKIRSKIGESLLIFNDLTGKNLSFDRAYVHFILVYNKQKNDKFETERVSSLNKFVDVLASKADDSYLLEGFKHYQFMFKNVKTINEEEFKNLVDNGRIFC